VKTQLNFRETIVKQPAWQHYACKDIEESLKELGSNRNGLAISAVHDRLTYYGKNVLSIEQTPWWYFLVRQYTGIFSYALLAIALFYYSTGSSAESLLVFAIYIINGLLAFAQEYRSDRAVKVLQKYLEHSASVVREGSEVIVPTSQVVPGDIVIIRAGDLVPADIRIIELHRASLDESIMTGESLPVEKSTAMLSNPPSTLHEATCIAYAGTQVAQGVMVGVVIATGSNTTLGDIGIRARATIRTSTFAEEMPRITKFIGLLLLVSLVLIYAINLIVKGQSAQDLWRMVIITVALIVSTIPEALPLVITSSLAQGAVRLAQHGAVIVKRLSAVEDLGHMQILCCDKTGTLTEHKLSIAQIFSKNTQKTLLFARLAGAPLSLKKTALHGFDLPIYESLSPDLLQELKTYKRIDELPFDPRNQATITVVSKENDRLVVTLGVPEKLLHLTSSLDEQEKKSLMEKTREAGARGERVISVAIRHVNAHEEPITDPEQPYSEFIGIITFHDPIKKTAASAITMARKLKVTIKVISGDSAEVCGYVAYELGLISDPEQVMTGDQWDALSGSDRLEALQKYHIFARCVPQQKVEIVQALKQTGMSVGYMGDGVNDMLPLKEANVAIAVQNAPDVVYESADIILVHKSLLNVINGIAAGRTVVHNIITYLRISLATSFSNFYSISIASLFIPFPDVFPLHMLIVNLLSDLPLVTIATDHVDPQSLASPQRFGRTAMLKSTIGLALLNSFMDLLFLLWFYKLTAHALETSWVLWSILSELGIIFALRTTLSVMRATRPSWQLATSCSVAAITAMILPFSRFGIHSLGYSRLMVSDIGSIIALVILYFILAELVKPLIFGKDNELVSVTMPNSYLTRIR
jgi:Mg2+-importing ATPase